MLATSNSQLNTLLERILLRDGIVNGQSELTKFDSDCLYTDTLIEQGKLKEDVANVILSEACGVHALDPTHITCSPDFLTHLLVTLPSL